METKYQFIEDKNNNMTIQDKNKQLAAELSISPFNDMLITHIDRQEAEASMKGGWKITYI